MDEEQQNQEVDRIKTELIKILDTNLVTESIKDNKIEFEHNNVKYRLHKPTYQEKEKVNQTRYKHYISLLKDSGNILEAELIKIYKDKGIDIVEMQKRIENLSKQRNDIAYKLGQAIKENKPLADLEPYKKEIESILIELQELGIRRAVLLESSIESQINMFVYMNLGYLVTDKLLDNTWTRAWDNLASFTSESDELINKVVWNVTLVARDEIPVETKQDEENK